MSSFIITRKKTPFQKHHEEEEAKKKRAEDETARLYAEFLESFQGGTAGLKTFVQGGTVNDEKVKPDTGGNSKEVSGSKKGSSLIMETEDWAGGSSDSEVSSPDIDNEDHCYAVTDLPKLQFRKGGSKAHWKEELGMAEIVSNKGRMWITTGILRGGKLYIFLEDILFLAEIGALDLFDDDEKGIPLGDIYKKVAGGVGGSSWESFEVYRHLKSLGYIIKRHGVCWSMKHVKSAPASVEGESENGCEERASVTEITELFSTMQINEPRLVFDVYPPNSKFRKSSLGDPIFILCVSSDGPPTKKQIEDLEGQCEGIPLKFCYVEHGREIRTHGGIEGEVNRENVNQI